MKKKGSATLGFILLVIVLGITLVLYLASSQVWVLGALGLEIILGSLMLYLIYFQTSGQLRRKLFHLQRSLAIESMEVLKYQYMDVYYLYMRLHERKKPNFYGRIIEIRQNIEEQLKAEKELERKIADLHAGKIKEEQNAYADLYSLYQKLPQKVQRKYYSEIMQLREELEKEK